MWRKVAPSLSKKFTLVMPDLRGYGDSSGPPDGENHSGYSKRAMAQDQVELMTSLGFGKVLQQRFPYPVRELYMEDFAVNRD